MVVEQVEKSCRDYIANKNTRWEYGNRILYDMCKNDLYHNQIDIIVGKNWIIGRSFAAAIERRINANDSNDDFYYDVVAPKILKISNELDFRISSLRSLKGTILDNVKEILETYKLFMDTFYEITGYKVILKSTKKLIFKSS